MITSEDKAAVAAALEGPLLTQGPQVADLENEFAETVGARFVVSCSNGTAALHLVYLGLGVGPGAGVIVPEITFLATANAARMCGAPVWFADVDPDTGLMTASTLAAAIDSAPFPIAVATPVHLAGRPCNMPELADVARSRGVELVEDACHAPGAVYADRAGTPHRVGACTHSRAATFSLHAIKHIAAGEGGLIATSDKALADHLMLLRSHGIIRDRNSWISPPEEPEAPWYYEMHELGWNYRLTEIQAALARSQLKRLKASVERRQEISEIYNSLLAEESRLTPPSSLPSGWTNARHLYPICADFGESVPLRGEVMQRLAEHGVGSQVLYIPVSQQPYYRSRGLKCGPGAHKYYNRTLAIPMYEALTAEDQVEIISLLKRAIL